MRLTRHKLLGTLARPLRNPAAQKCAVVQKELLKTQVLTAELALMRQNKYRNNIVEQDHRAVKTISGPMLGFKSFWSARIIAGIETMHMIKKGQMNCPEGSTLSAAQQFYSLAV